MSRSRRKSPFCGLAGDSEKFDKRINNRKLRRKCKEAILNDKELPIMKEVSNPWSMAKDGKIKIDEDSKEMWK